MKYTADLTRSAEADLNDIVEWIARDDSVPLELRNLGIDRYRQVLFMPYRIIYHVRNRRVIVNLIVDGRRDMSVLLQRRLTAAT